MVMPGETVNSDTTTCLDCETELKIKVLKSNAGYYIGFFCPNCGPYSRESGYYKYFSDAEEALTIEKELKIKTYGR